MASAAMNRPSCVCPSPLQGPLPLRSPPSPPLFFPCAAPHVTHACSDSETPPPGALQASGNGMQHAGSGASGPGELGAGGYSLSNVKEKNRMAQRRFRERQRDLIVQLKQRAELLEMKVGCGSRDQLSSMQCAGAAAVGTQPRTWPWPCMRMDAHNAATQCCHA